MKIKFMKEKETPGTIRYKETHHDGALLKDGETPIIGTLYVKKIAASGREQIEIDFPVDGE